MVSKFDKIYEEVLNENQQLEKDIINALKAWKKEFPKDDGAALKQMSHAFMMIDRPLHIKLDKLRPILKQMYLDGKIMIGQGINDRLKYSLVD